MFHLFKCLFKRFFLVLWAVIRFIFPLLWRTPVFGRRKVTEGLPLFYSCQPKPAWVRREVICLKALMPLAGCRIIAYVFNRSLPFSPKYHKIPERKNDLFFIC